MLISFTSLVADHGLNVTGVLHCGARLGEEADEYEANGISNVWWVDGNPEIIPRLRQNVEGRGHHVIEALLTDTDGADVTFRITNWEGMSSSIFEFGTHKNFSPDTVFVNEYTLKSRTVDSLVAEYGITGCNMMNLDLQGAELLTFKGATEFLKGVDVIYSEVNTEQVYIGCAQLSELDEYLSDFNRVAISMCGNQGWGDALWVRK